ncbi:DUF5325 family protein [Brevibacillus fulvus]|uniref:F0F1-type ATP synthase assembly protein I n=1 Tax=Brevibacillus fulvus TaxID=1125967 RepID=A0A938Y1A6_9BACL|nr:DUF5325 family protein [Brevibacillus fulvus]MBM7589767.1 F0F1-type ATP synthase assembly protein I [Brevibacillus fulvus]
MTRYQVVTFVLAVCVAACIIGIGVAIAEQSITGIIACLLGSAVFMGSGFRYKRKHLR